MNLDGKRVVLTGAGSGIGRALLEQLAGYRTQIVAVDYRSDALDIAITETAGNQAEIIAYVCDVSLAERNAALFDFATEQLGGIDLFIACAGFAYYEALQNADWAHVDQIFRVNVYAPIFAALKMGELNPNTPYKVVVVASTMAHLGLPGYALYGATKAALHRFAESYRYELADPSALTLVYPIATRTGFFSAASARQTAPIPKPSQTSAYVANAIIKGIERNRPSIYTSYAFGLYRILSRVFPMVGRFIQYNEWRVFRRWLG